MAKEITREHPPEITNTNRLPQTRIIFRYFACGSLVVLVLIKRATKVATIAMSPNDLLLLMA